jgi:hypothetical protein
VIPFFVLPCLLCFTRAHDAQEPAWLARRERALAAWHELDTAIPRSGAGDRRASRAEFLGDLPDGSLGAEAREQPRVDETLDHLDPAAELVAGLRLEQVEQPPCELAARPERVQHGEVDGARMRGSRITSQAVREKTARMRRWIMVGGPTQVVSISSSSENNRSRPPSSSEAVARYVVVFSRSIAVRRLDQCRPVVHVERSASLGASRAARIAG